MAAASPPTPFAEAPGQHVWFNDAAGGEQGSAGGSSQDRKRKLSVSLSRGLSSLVLDEAFDNLLPLSPSLDNFLNVATTCLHGQALLPGRLYSASMGRSLSAMGSLAAMGSLDLNWLPEGAMGHDAAGGGPEGVVRMDCEGMEEDEGPAKADTHPAGASQRGAAGLPPLPLSKATGSAPAPSTPHALLPAGVPVTSGAQGLLPPTPATSAAPARHPALVTSSSEGGRPATPHTLGSTVTAGAASAASAQQLGMEVSPFMQAGSSTMTPELQQQLAAQAYQQQQQQQALMQMYQPQLGEQAGPGSANSPQVAWSNGAGEPDPSSAAAAAAYSSALAAAAAAYMKHLQAAAASPNALPPVPPLVAPSTTPRAVISGAPLTPESAMAARQAQQAQQLEAWQQQVQQQAQQAAMAALMQACSSGGSSVGSGWGYGGAGTADAQQLVASSSWPSYSGLMPTPGVPTQATNAQPPGVCPFQLHVRSVPSFKVSTVLPVRLSQSNTTIIPNNK